MEHLNWKGTHFLHRWPLHHQFNHVWKNLTFNKKLNGTKSQRTPFSKLRSSYEKYSVFFGVRNPWVLFEFSWIRFFFVKFPAMGVVWSKEQIVNLERFGAALLVTSECTLAAWRSRGHSDEQIFENSKSYGMVLRSQVPWNQVLVDGSGRKI